MSNKLEKPNFFIVGAPKCGTTSLYHYLKKHPDIFMSDVKEPSYFNTDFTDEFRNITEREEYIKLFKKAKDYQAVRGEASASYLYSEEAIPNILEFNSNARFIVMIRDPIEMFRSYHQQLLEGLNENVQDSEQAWRLQEKRRNGKRIPPTCREDKLLQYGEICKLGKQIKRLYNNVPDRGRVKIIKFSDFKNNTKWVYESTLDFLDLKSDNRGSFPVYNKAAKTKVKFIKKIKSLINNKTTNRISRYLKRRIGIKHWSFLVNLRQWNRVTTEKPTLEKSFRQELENYFREDQKLLKKIIKNQKDHY